MPPWWFWGGSHDGVLPSRCLADCPEWRSCPFSAALSRSFHGGGHSVVSHSDGHSVVRAKKKPAHQNQPQRDFRSAEASLMYRPCISQVPKGMCLCVIWLIHLYGNTVYHIELMFVNCVLGNFMSFTFFTLNILDIHSIFDIIIWKYNDIKLGWKAYGWKNKASASTSNARTP